MKTWYTLAIAMLVLSVVGCTSQRRCTGRDMASAVNECDAACGQRDDGCFERCIDARCAEDAP